MSKKLAGVMGVKLCAIACRDFHGSTEQSSSVKHVVLEVDIELLNRLEPSI